jgi:hypothetical protein
MATNSMQANTRQLHVFFCLFSEHEKFTFETTKAIKAKLGHESMHRSHNFGEGVGMIMLHIYVKKIFVYTHHMLLPHIITCDSHEEHHSLADATLHPLL